MRPLKRRGWARRVTVGQAAITAILVVVFIAEAYPLFYVLSLSVMPYANYIRQSVHAWPSGFTMAYYQDIFGDSGLLTSFEISGLKTVVGTALSVVVTTMAAYALSRPKLRLGRLLTFLFLIPLFVGGGLIPYFLVIRAVGLLNTFWALVLPGVVAPFFVFMARANFANYPNEILEAATVDGAGQFTTFWRIVWPTSLPIISTLALLYGVGQWNEYFWSSILVQSNLYPASVVIFNFISGSNMLNQLGLGTQIPPQSLFAAMAGILIIPILVIYPFMQRYLLKGLIIGAIKG